MTPGPTQASTRLPPGDEALPCVGHPIELTLVAPNLYFVLDHSTSMKQMAKWTNVRQVVAQLITQLGAGARFGATLFPGSGDQCDPGVEVMSLRQGDAQGVVAGTFLAATAADPDGGTPTAATLEHLVPTLSGLEGTTFAILATDGGPNCNASLSCPANQCTGNIDGVPGCPADFSMNCCALGSTSGQSCLDDVAAVQAASDSRRGGRRDLRPGHPGERAVRARPRQAGHRRRHGAVDRAPLLCRRHGRHGRPHRGARADRGPYGRRLHLHAGEPAQRFEGMRVVLNGAVIPSTGPDRWTLSGTTLTLHGASCASVQTAGAPSLQFFDGCGG